MNEIIDTSTRLFMAVVGPSGSGKKRIIFQIFEKENFLPQIWKSLNFLTMIFNL